MNFLDTVELGLSRWSLLNIDADQTTVNLTAHYLDSLFAVLKDECNIVMSQTYQSLGMVNLSVYNAVLMYIDWSEEPDPDNPFFEFNLLNARHDLTFTMLQLAEKKTIITNITCDGISVVHRLTSTIASIKGTNEDKGIHLSGGSASIPEIEGSTFDIGYYTYGYYRGREFLEPKPITEDMSRESFLSYITSCLYGDDFVMLPMDVEFMEVKHPCFKEVKFVNTENDLYLGNILPMTYLDHGLAFHIYDKEDYHVLEFSELKQCWDIRFVEKRVEGDILNFIGEELRKLSFDGVCWNTIEDSDKLWYAITLKYNGEETMIRWDRPGTTSIDHPIISVIGDLDRYNKRIQLRYMCELTAIGSMLDENSGMLFELIDGLNDYIDESIE